MPPLSARLAGFYPPRRRVHTVGAGLVGSGSRTRRIPRPSLGPREKGADPGADGVAEVPGHLGRRGAAAESQHALERRAGRLAARASREVPLHLGTGRRVDLAFEVSREQAQDIGARGGGSRQAAEERCQAFSDLKSRPVESTLDGFDAEPSHLGHLVRRETFDVSEYEGLPILGLEGGDGGVERRGEPPVFHLLVGSG